VCLTMKLLYLHQAYFHQLSWIDTTPRQPVCACTCHNTLLTPLPDLSLWCFPSGTRQPGFCTDADGPLPHGTDLQCVASAFKVPAWCHLQGLLDQHTRTHSRAAQHRPVLSSQSSIACQCGLPGALQVEPQLAEGLLAAAAAHAVP